MSSQYYKGRIAGPLLLEKAWNRIKPLLEISDTGCWLINCRGRPDKDIYPQITVENHTEAAHRISYLHHKGELPYGHIVRHTCDVRRCCNPDHLISGTIYDNMRDKVERGRCHHMRGEKASRAKIPDAEIMAIYSSDEPRDLLAGRYGIHPHNITRIRMAKHSLTKHLPPRRMNDSAHFTAERAAKISTGRRGRPCNRTKVYDKKAHGSPGERHPKSKLSEQDALAIFHSDEDNNELARRYGICNRSIRDVKAGRHWATGK